MRERHTYQNQEITVDFVEATPGSFVWSVKAGNHSSSGSNIPQPIEWARSDALLIAHLLVESERLRASCIEDGMPGTDAHSSLSSG